MKRLVFSMTLVVLAGLLAGTSQAGAQSMLATFTVPFAFTVGESNLPAGDYLVYGGPVRGVVWIRSSDCKIAVAQLPIPHEYTVAPTKSTLVFRRIGNTYFLEQAATAGLTIGWDFQKSRRQREAEQLAAEREKITIEGKKTLMALK